MYNRASIPGGLIAAALLSAGLSAGALASDENPTLPDGQQAKALIKRFVGDLQGELKAAMQDGGPAKAVAVCKERAPAIAESLSEESGWQIGRTSLKTRNAELNSPDDWERHVLQQFEDRLHSGADPQTISYSEVVEDGDGKIFRFMKAIPAGDVCMACHGKDVSPEVAAAVAESYPDDQAVGYEPGQLRGAFSLSKPF